MFRVLRLIFKWLFVLAGAVAVGALFYTLLVPRFMKKKDAEWKTEKLNNGDLSLTVTASGTVSPLQTVQLGSQVSGIVKKILKGANERVKKGETLAILDTELLDNEKQSADAKLLQTRAQLRQIQVDRDNLLLREERFKATLARKQASVARAKGTYELAKLERQRSEFLVTKEASAQSDLDTKKLNESNSQLDMRLMEIDLDDCANDLKQIQLDKVALDVREEQAKTDIKQAQTVYNRAVTNLGFATIISPIDGVILEQNVQSGQTLAATFQTPNVFKIASDLKEIQIDAKIDEVDIGKIKSGQDVTFEVDAYRGETFKGVVATVSLQAENKNNLVTYAVAILAKNPSDEAHEFGKLLPGMTANLRFVVETRKNALLLPSAALRFVPPPMAVPKADEKETQVDEKNDAKKKGVKGKIYVLDDKKALKSVTVRVGETDGDKYELIDSGGLHDGDAVVTGGGPDRFGFEQ